MGVILPCTEKENVPPSRRGAASSRGLRQREKRKRRVNIERGRDPRDFTLAEEKNRTFGRRKRRRRTCAGGAARSPLSECRGKKEERERKKTPRCVVAFSEGEMNGRPGGGERKRNEVRFSLRRGQKGKGSTRSKED